MGKNKKHLILLLVLALTLVFCSCGKAEEEGGHQLSIAEPIPGFEEGAVPEPEPEPVELTQEECLALWSVINDPENNKYVRANFTDAASVPAEGMFYGLWYGEGSLLTCIPVYGVKTGNLYDIRLVPLDNGWIRVPEIQLSMEEQEDGSFQFLSNEIMWNAGALEGYPVETEELSECSGKANLVAFPPVNEYRLPAVQVVDGDGKAYVTYPEARPDDLPAGNFGGISGVEYTDTDGDGSTDLIVHERFGETAVKLTYLGFDPKEEAAAFFHFAGWEEE